MSWCSARVARSPSVAADRDRRYLTAQGALVVS
ncbi:hypothetical protein PssvBMR6_gp57 [Pseudomonas phage MR6]|uniref:Uncharacterized protein n=1 Tax=Pseudomonas phage MR5 TaxID=2711172 RepID=A0A6M3TCW6_9CAUD|nr:hypothetical protein PssvBMR5_gp58 [Pseudomonas phage MR5]QJD54885.1 hypothetical protein PssvBMR6_gp57 [Pseudomonas phage MR6]QJD54946.1 hypothetical protein PssvBMR7_gp59 [Pseudomonas phage MR7]